MAVFEMILLFFHVILNTLNQNKQIKNFREKNYYPPIAIFHRSFKSTLAGSSPVNAKDIFFTFSSNLSFIVYLILPNYAHLT